MEDRECNQLYSALYLTEDLVSSLVCVLPTVVGRLLMCVLFPSAVFCHNSLKLQVRVIRVCVSRCDLVCQLIITVRGNLCHSESESSLLSEVEGKG